MSGSTSPDVVNIAQTGSDLILQVGDPGVDHAKLLVSSVILKQVSSVFTALLGPQFREGQAAKRSEEDPHTIELLEDDATVMQDMCSLIHHKPNSALHPSGEPAHSLDPVRVLYLVVAVEKYDCIEALRLQCIGLLSTISTTEGLNRAQIVAAGAFLFNNSRIFREATRDWIMSSTCTHKAEPLQTGVLSEILPGRVYDIVAAKQAQFRDILIIDVPALVMDAHTCGDTGCASSAMEELCNRFDVSWWPGRKISALNALEKLPGIVGLGCGCEDDVELPEVVRLMGDIKEVCGGLCLQCVRTMDAWKSILSQNCTNPVHQF